MSHNEIFAVGFAIGIVATIFTAVVIFLAIEECGEDDHDH